MQVEIGTHSPGIVRGKQLGRGPAGEERTEGDIGRKDDMLFAHCNPIAV